MSGFNYCFLTRIQVSHKTVKVVWYSHLFKNFPLIFVIHTVKAFSIVNEAEEDVFLESLAFIWSNGFWQFGLWFLCLFLIKPSLYIWKLLVHVLLKPSLEDFEHDLASMWSECNCALVWTLFCMAFLWFWTENWSFPVLWPLLNFPNLLTYYIPKLDLQ